MSNGPTLSNVERQARYRRKAQIGKLKRIEVTLPLEDTLKLKHLAKHWECTQTGAFKWIPWIFGQVSQCTFMCIVRPGTVIVPERFGALRRERLRINS